MPKDEIDLKFDLIIKQLDEISADSKEIKSILQQHAIDVVSIKKDIERIDKEREEDKAANEKAINIVHKSIEKRDKKQMWFTGIMVGIGGVLATIASIFLSK